MIIESIHNESYKLFRKLKEVKTRKKLGLFIVEGKHLVEEAKAHGVLVHCIKNADHVCDLEHDSVYTLSSPLYQSLSEVNSQSECMGVCRYPSLDKQFGSRVMVFDRIQDPGNFGTMIRTAVSFGFDAIIASSDCVDLGNEKVIRSTQGALFQIPVLTQSLDDVLPRLKSQGFVICGTALEDALALENYTDHPEKIALIFGNEGAGVSSSILDQCDLRLKIEMAQFESLNVAIACGILAYRFRAS